MVQIDSLLARVLTIRGMLKDLPALQRDLAAALKQAVDDEDDELSNALDTLNDAFAGIDLDAIDAGIDELGEL